MFSRYLAFITFPLGMYAENSDFQFWAKRLFFYSLIPF